MKEKKRNNNKTTSKRLGDKLKEARIDKGITQAKLLDATNIYANSRMIRYIESGQRNIPRENLLIWLTKGLKYCHTSTINEFLLVGDFESLFPEEIEALCLVDDEVEENEDEPKPNSSPIDLPEKYLEKSTFYRTLYLLGATILTILFACVGIFVFIINIETSISTLASEMNGTLLVAELNRNSEQLRDSVPYTVTYAGIEDPPFDYPEGRIPHKFRQSTGARIHLSPDMLHLIFNESFGLDISDNLVGGGGTPYFWMFLPDPETDGRQDVAKLYEQSITIRIPVTEDGIHNGEFVEFSDIMLEQN